MGKVAFKLAGLTGREYKMLLAPEKLAGLPEEAGSRFWELLGPIVNRRRVRGTPKLGSFEAVFEGSERQVQYRDTDDLALDAKGYSLRLRDEGKSREITLKLRTADILESGTANLSVRSGKKVEEKFEEDIAPLEVQTSGKTVAIAMEPSIRSRFSRSTTRKRPKENRLARFADAVALFETLGSNLEAVRGAIPLTARLNSGPRISEYVFKSQSVQLDHGVEIVLALTLWYFDRSAPPDRRMTPKVAEISFQWETDRRGRISGAEAACGRDLFRAIQDDLAGWLDPNISSKTRLALPPRRPGKSGRRSRRPAAPMRATAGRGAAQEDARPAHR
jgi:hypothetical protein